MTTLHKINKYLKRNNIDAEILAGKGYIYFAGPATAQWRETIVGGLFNVKCLTDEQGFRLFTEMCEVNAMGGR